MYLAGSYNFNLRLQESTTGTGAKPVSESFRFLQHFISFIIVHEPSSEAHVSGMIPDTQIFLVRFLCNLMLIDKSRTSTFLLYCFFLKWGENRGEKERRTVYSSTFFLILSSSCLRLLFAPVVSSSTGASVTLLFFPETSSASLCCLSAGVSVHNELSDLLLAGPEPRENWRAFNLVGSRSMFI